MQVVVLTVTDFKSYKGHHTLLLGDSYFTSIIGPNGSGKSNSMDAISFVLGIKSSHLRSAHLRDLVYRGRVLRTSTINGDGSATAPNGDHAVEEDISNVPADRNDPKSAWVMAVYENDAGREQTWKRSITSQGSSEYRINNRVVNAPEYNAALEKENILIKARNFLVFQGDVEAIASQQPKDLTRMIEQISGSLEYKAEYDRLKEEMEEAAEKQNHNLHRRRGINSEIKQYQEQKREAESFEKKTGERDEAIVRQVLFKLFRLEKAIEGSERTIDGHRKSLKKVRAEIEGFEAKLEAARAEQAQAQKEIQKAERAHKKKEHEIEDTENKLEPVNEKMRIAESHIQSSRSRIGDVEKEQTAQSASIDKLKKSLTTVEKAQAIWEAEHAKAAQREGRELGERDLQEYNKLKEQVSVQSSGSQIQLQELTRRQRTEDETVKSLKSSLEASERQIVQYEKELKTLTDRRSELSAETAQLKADIDAKKKELNSAVSDRLRVSRLQRELDEKLQEVLKKLIDADDGRRQNERQQRIRESTIELKRSYPGVKGRVSELCRPTLTKYEEAVSTVLGRHFDAVVVDTEKTAKDCIQFLRDQRLGQATFLPLETIQIKAVQANLKGLHRGVRPAIDCIEYDTAYHRAMAYVCGSDVICDTLQVARDVCYTKNSGVKAVTLDGTIIHKAGLMTGGHGPNDKKAKFQDINTEKLRRAADNLKQQIEDLPRASKLAMQEETLQSAMRELDGKMAYAQDEMRSLDRNTASKQKELDHARKTLKDGKPAHDAKVKALAKTTSDLEKLQTAVSTVEDKVFGAFCKRLGYSSIREYEASQWSVAQEASKKKLEFTTQRSRLENMLTFEVQQLDSTKKRIAKLEQSAERDKTTVDELKVEKKSISKALDVARDALKKLSASVKELQEAYEAKKDATEKQRGEVSKRNKTAAGIQDEVGKQEADIQRTAANRFALLRKCKLEDIAIPLAGGSNSLDKLPLEDNLLQESDVMDVDPDPATGLVSAATPVDDYGISVDFTKLEAKYKKAPLDDAQDVELSDAITALNAELEKMAPNMKAIDRLEDVESRLKGTEKDFEASRRAAKRARDDFDRVRDLRYDLFSKAFNHISSQIGTVYKDLTRSDTFPLGGNAYLDMEDSDEPFLSGIKYHAMPPLKRFRDMELLSGGEKTMAALALLFAVHSYQPSPFFVLDEVDAALDNANVAKIANYVRDHAGPGMQFVVISLKTTFFERSQALVGIYRDQVGNSSRALTLDVSLTPSFSDQH